MLDDTSRKVLRTLYNLHRAEEFKINVHLVARYSMRDVTRVKAAVNDLVKQEYLIWDRDRGIFRVDTNKRRY